MALLWLAGMAVRAGAPRGSSERRAHHILFWQRATRPGRPQHAAVTRAGHACGGRARSQRETAGPAQVLGWVCEVHGRRAWGAHAPPAALRPLPGA